VKPLGSRVQLFEKVDLQQPLKDNCFLFCGHDFNFSLLKTVRKIVATSVLVDPPKSKAATIGQKKLKYFQSPARILGY
jgi:hypothetical protein